MWVWFDLEPFAKCFTEAELLNQEVTAVYLPRIYQAVWHFGAWSVRMDPHRLYGKWVRVEA